MRVYDKRTYVVCPRKVDYLDWCRDHKVDLQDQSYIHVHHPMQLLGRRINPDDDIEYTNILGFSGDCYYEILKQLKMRSTGHEFP